MEGYIDYIEHIGVCQVSLMAGLKMEGIFQMETS